MELKLPNTVGSRRDIIHMQREIERLLEEHLQHDIAKEQTGELRGVSKPTAMVRETLRANDMKSDTQQLKELSQKLEAVMQRAPRIRIAFANEPDSNTYEKIVGWFRREIHPDVLLQIGVQPTIAGGCIVQAGQHRYDFSLRKRLLDKTNLFVKVMHRVK